MRKGTFAPRVSLYETMRRLTDVRLGSLRDALLTSLALVVPACTSHTGEEEPPERILPPPPPARGMCGLVDPEGKQITTLAGGFIRCQDGSVNRVEDARPVSHKGAACTSPGAYGCTVDTDCKATGGGQCTQQSGQIGDYCQCVNECIEDSDCGDQQVCVAKEVVDSLKVGESQFNVCVAATCMTGKDCELGECALTGSNDGCGSSFDLSCRTEKDSCRANEGCAEFGACTAAHGDDTHVLSCRPQGGCVVGRPFLIDSEARRASVVHAASDWSARVRSSRVEGLSAERRREHAAYWANIATMEHASIAAFARFTLELLARGAPAVLVRESQEAGLDELEHARLAFALASQYAGQELAPGNLDIGGALDADANDFVDSLVLEGCIGESVAAAIAAAHAEATGDEAVRVVLERVIADETRHAALAWKTLRWAMSQGGDAVVARVERLLRSAEREAVPHHTVVLGCDDVPTAQDEAAIRAAALRSVVRPVWDSLRASSRGRVALRA